jgi:hypothetical protein
MTTYLTKFTRKVFELLGGQDMAHEFLALHPEIPEKMRAAAVYHQRKGGRAWKGACIFYRFEIKPLLQRDRKRACRRPIGR